MKCKDCNCCHIGWFGSKPGEYVCIGVPEPFVIDDINHECTEYKYKRDQLPDISKTNALKQLYQEQKDLKIEYGKTESKNDAGCAKCKKLKTIISKLEYIDYLIRTILEEM